jgi:hypothetical protein
VDPEPMDQLTPYLFAAGGALLIYFMWKRRR